MKELLGNSYRTSPAEAYDEESGRSVPLFVRSTTNQAINVRAEDKDKKRHEEIVDEVEMTSEEVTAREMGAVNNQVGTEHTEEMIGKEDTTNKENNNDEPNKISSSVAGRTSRINMFASGLSVFLGAFFYLWIHLFRLWLAHVL